MTTRDEGQGLNSISFFPHCSLKDDSRISVYEITIDFTKHLLPLGMIAEMGVYSLSDFVGSLRFAATQSACVFV